MGLLKTKLRQYRHKRTSPRSQHPREYLKEIVNLAAYQLYGLENSLNISRQDKPLNFESKGFIDYVVACFDLANILGQPANEVAQDVTSQLKKWLTKKNPEMLDDIKPSVIAGYINFELSDKYIAEASYSVAHWLQKPQDRVKKNRTAFIIVEGSVFGEVKENKSINETFYFIKELYSSAGFRIQSKYIASDASEDVAARIVDKFFRLDYQTPELAKIVPAKNLITEIETAKFRQKIRNLLGGSLDSRESPLIVSSIKKMRLEFLEYCEKTLKSNYLDPQDIKLESELTEKVQEWLSNTTKKKGHIVTDGHSRATYYHIQLGPLAPLRSAGGVLFKAAYLLHSLDIALQENKNKRNLIIAIVPQKYHQLLYGHADLSTPGTSYNTFICIDPLLAHAALPKREKALGPLALTFQGIAHTLAGAVTQKAHKTTQRSKLLALIDFPVELNELVMQVRLLEVVSLISAVINTVKEFNR